MKVLILYASAGNGHRRAAEALAQAFKAYGRQHTVVVCDILDYTPGIFRKTYAKGYLRLVRHTPELWGYMYAVLDRKGQAPWRRKVSTTFNRINTARYFDFYSELSPDVVICTHFMPLELMATSSRRRRQNVPVFGVITDFAVHSLWVDSNVETYYVATEEAARQMIRRGQPQTGTVVSGIPIDPVFTEKRDRKAAREQLGVGADIPTVLILSGGFGVGPTIELLRSFKSYQSNLQLLVVAGANEELEKKANLTAEELNMRVHVYGFVNNIDLMMDASDLVVSKPGGLTSSEVLAKGKPMVIVDPIPGQEQRNCEYLLERGAAVRLFEIEDAPCKIGNLLNNPARLEAMSTAAAQAGRPSAAQDIVEDVINRVFSKKGSCEESSI